MDNDGRLQSKNWYNFVSYCLFGNIGIILKDLHIEDKLGAMRAIPAITTFCVVDGKANLTLLA